MVYLSFVFALLFLKQANGVFLNTFEAVNLLLEERLTSSDEFILGDFTGDINHFVGMKACKYGLNNEIQCMQRGKVELEKGYWCENDNVTESTVFNIGSITKMFAIATLLRLMEEKPSMFPNGLNTKLSFYMPYLNEVYGNYKYVHDLPRRENFSKITLQNLIQHTSGISDHNFDGKLLNNKIKQISESEFLSDELVKPNVKYGNFSYSNIGYNTIAIIMTSITNAKFSDLVKKYVIKPLNLKQTFPVDDFVNVGGRIEFKDASNSLKHSIARSYFYFNNSVQALQNFNWDTCVAGMYSTPSDLIIFINEFFKEKNNVLFNEKTINEIKNFEVIDTGAIESGSYGLGFFIFQNGLRGHLGGDLGINALLAFDPATKSSAAIVLTGENLSNTANIIWSYEKRKAIPVDKSQSDFCSSVLKL